MVLLDTWYLINGNFFKSAEVELFVVTQVDTDGWQQTFLYVTLGSVAFINVNAAIFQVGTERTLLDIYLLLCLQVSSF